MKKKKNKYKNNETQNQPTLVAFLLDRTGSMSSCKEETIKGFNGYLAELRKKSGDDMRFTLTQFDTVSIDIVHDGVPLDEVDELSNKNYEPRGGTPLYDAMGKTIRATSKSAGDKCKVLFVTLTDGEENSSSEWNSESIKKLIKEMESDKHWTFAYIGMGLNGWQATKTLSVGTMSASNVLRTSGKNAGMAYRHLAGQTVCYAASAASGQSVCQDFFAGKTSTEDEEQ